MGMSCLDCHDYMDGYNRGKKEGTVEELENLVEVMKKKETGKSVIQTVGIWAVQ